MGWDCRMAREHGRAIRVLHLVKTLDGADWAARQVRELASLGVEVHVALPPGSGRTSELWSESGAKIHALNTALPFRSAHLLPRELARFRSLVDTVNPDLIHAHFVTNILFARLALAGSVTSPKRVFQVPGPLHMEHVIPRTLELLSSGPRDSWIASSRYIRDLYRSAGIPSHRVFLSYYGTDLDATPDPRSSSEVPIRSRISAARDAFLVGNVSYLYAPKRLLGQRRGLKNHELMMEASSLTSEQVSWVFVGNQWGRSQRYFERIRRKASATAAVTMLGYMDSQAARSVWSEFDLAVHVPTSENCGGVVEPLLAGVPVVASNVGGLPEVVVDGQSGRLVSADDPVALADTVEWMRLHPEQARTCARRGQALVTTMFDVRRTAQEVFAIYSHLVLGTPPPHEFISESFLAGSSDREVGAPGGLSVTQL